ncbi:nitroreductase family protein [Nocardia shimofusensis]|uniref:nitroreductase family protein n=1 Tax=Nocardia shimofusensis TaxID=228596 RepID=UPI0008371AE8|nr:nitroreductase family protein [Nocardia shimofusensis]
MPTVTYSEQTRYALCDGVTFTTTSAGASLYAPPRNVELTDLADGQILALRTLNQGPKTVSEIAAQAGGADVAPLLEQLADGGWLAVTIRDGGRDLYTIRPFDRPAPRPTHPLPSWSATLSKFAVLHRDCEGFVLEHPRSWCTLRIHDPRLLALLDGLGSADANIPIAVKTQFADDLHWCGFLVADDRTEELEAGTRRWGAADLWFHRRSTSGAGTGEHRSEFGDGGAESSRVPVRRPGYAGEAVRLSAPDLRERRASDPSLAAVMEDRISTRAFDDARPMTVEQLGELLYRTARSRGSDARSAARPYPSRDDAYEIELYPVVRDVAGLAPGMYHYDSFEHELRPVAPADSLSVRRLLDSSTNAQAASGAPRDGAPSVNGAPPGAGASPVGAGGPQGTASPAGQPQVLIVLSARAGRALDSYGQVGYATILQHVGALTQTLYLAGTAMGLGICAQPFTEPAAFAAATGNDELDECGVGAIVVGTPARR